MEITFKDAAEATGYLLARDAEAKAMRRVSKDTLVSVYMQRGGLTPRNMVAKWSKNQLLSTLLDADFPLESVNLAIHVRTHTQSFPDCPHCQPKTAAEWSAAIKAGTKTLADYEHSEQGALAEDTFALIERSEGM